jgi:hypothetical protein
MPAKFLYNLTKNLATYLHNNLRAVSPKIFLVQQFFKNAAEVKGEESLSSPAGDETPLPTNRPKQYSLKMFRGTFSKCQLIKIDFRRFKGTATP